MSKKNNNIQLEILKSSYWEHEKFAKDLAYLLPLEHPKRIKIQKETNLLADQIRQLSK